MPAIRNTKLCWNCEGNINVYLSQCPHCGINLTDQKKPKMDFPPPYQDRGSPPLEDPSIPPPPYPNASDFSQQNFEITNTEWDDTSTEETSQKDLPNDQAKATILSILLLGSSSLFFIFSFILLAFSQNSVFTLSWNSNYWTLYFILSILSLHYGKKYLNKVDNDT